MKLIFEPGDVVFLQKLKDYGDDLEDWGMDEGEFARFVLAYEKGHPMEVVHEECQGYYTIEDIRTGQRYEAISEYHLKPRVADVIAQLDL